MLCSSCLAALIFSSRCCSLLQDPVVRERACTFAMTDVIAILNNTPRPDPAKVLLQHNVAPPPTQQPGGAAPPLMPYPPPYG